MRNECAGCFAVLQRNPAGTEGNAQKQQALRRNISQYCDARRRELPYGIFAEYPAVMKINPSNTPKGIFATTAFFTTCCVFRTWICWSPIR